MIQKVEMVPTSYHGFIKEWAELLERLQLVGMQCHVPPYSGWSTTSSEQCAKTLFLLDKIQEILLIVENLPAVFLLDRPQSRQLRNVLLASGTAWFRLHDYHRLNYNEEVSSIAFELRENVEATLIEFLHALDNLVGTFLYEEEKFLQERVGR